MLNALAPRRRGALVSRPAWPARGWDSLFDEFWRDVGCAPLGAERGGFSPRIDIAKSDTEIRLTAELPGLEEKDFEVSLESDVLTLKGEKRTEQETEHEGVRYAERTSGSFHRAFRIPFPVDADQVKAVFKAGVLTVTVAVPEQAQDKVRTIPVSTS